MLKSYKITLKIAPKTLTEAEETKEVLDILAQQHQSDRTDFCYDLSSKEDVQLAALTYAAYFKANRKAEKFKSLDFVVNHDQYRATLLKSENARDILLLVGTALETLEEFPELSQEMIILPHASEEKGGLFLYVKSQETLDAFLKVFQKMLATQQRPNSDNRTTQLMQSIGLGPQ